MVRPITRVLNAVLLLSPVLTGASEPRQDPVAAAPQAQNAPPAAAQPAKPKPKKVWTNDNLPAGGDISVVGGQQKPARTDPKAATKPADQQVDPKLLARLRDELQKLQSQLAAVDQQLSDLKDLSKGESKSSGGVRPNLFGYDTSSIPDQIQRLQDKKTKLQSTIDDLFDAARAAGIEPGQLR